MLRKGYDIFMKEKLYLIPISLGMFGLLIAANMFYLGLGYKFVQLIFN